MGAKKPLKQTPADRLAQQQSLNTAQINERQIRLRSQMNTTGRTAGTLYGGPESGALGAGF